MDKILISLLVLAPCAAFCATYTTKDVDCSAYQKHQPRANVAYQNGVDVHGWAVAPADVNPPLFTQGEFGTVDIPIDIPVQDYINEDRYNVNSREMNIWAGKIRVEKDGRTELNGQDITQGEVYPPECARPIGAE